MPTPEENLKRTFNPRSVAVIGATEETGHVGLALMENLKNSGFEGEIYPVNLNRKEVLGLKAYSKIGDIPDTVDLSLVAIPAPAVPQVVDECGTADVGGVVVVSSGFKEVGSQGKELYTQLKEVVDSYPTRVIGPNCLGLHHPSHKLNASFSLQSARPGSVAFISQSGALGSSMLDWSIQQKVGFSYFVSIGEMIDVGFSHLIDFLAGDPQVNSILLYVETVKEPKRFLSAARAFARTRPLVVLKAGKSEGGARAALLHTGSMTGDNVVFEAVLERVGALRVDNLEELFDCTETLASQKLPQNNRLAMVTNAGGAAVIATDVLMSQGGQLANISGETQRKLREVLPPISNVSNPIDLLGDADPQRYRDAVSCCLDDSEIDGVLVILGPQAMSEPTEVARAIASLPHREKKTLVASWMGGDKVLEGAQVLEESGIPVYQYPERAVETFIKLYTYHRNLKILQQTPGSIPSQFTPRREEARDIVERVTAEGRNSLTEEEAKKLLSHYDMAIPHSVLAKSPDMAVEAAEGIGYPVAMKISAPGLLHKTECQGVELNLNSEKKVRLAYSEIMENCRQLCPQVEPEGVLVEEMVNKQFELLLGSKKDQLFGPVVLFGKGGVATEVYKDVNAALPPLNMHLAKKLMEDTQIFTLLQGYRGMKGVDLEQVQFLLYKFAYLVMDFPEIQQIDINPFAIDEDGGVVLDAKVVLDSEAAKSGVEPYSHLVIAPYPRELEKEIILDNGKKYFLRPIKPEDEPLHRELFNSFSEETKRLRFFGPISEMIHENLIKYTQIDYDREMAIIALDEKRNCTAGVARLVADPYNSHAEFAVVVGDPWQGQGLGSELTDYILEIARSRGVNRVHAYMVPDNERMKTLLKQRDFQIEKQKDLLRAWKSFGKR